MPATHEAQAALPSVSGSSGTLKASVSLSEGRHWPGQVFENPQLSYDQAMQAYVQARTQVPVVRESPSAYRTDADASRHDLKHQEEALRLQRRQLRQQRHQQDAAWHHLRQQRHAQKAQRQALKGKQRRACRASIQAEDAAWRAQRTLRKAHTDQRHAEDAAWRNARKDIRAQKETLSAICGWIAILVIIDNCTRQCLGLPLFIAGAHLTAEMVVSALQAFLPVNLQYLIADRGVHFRAQLLEDCASAKNFIRVLLAPHRPQSNGIAERFIRTLKEALETHSWKDPVQLSDILQQVNLQYNERPHQGKELNGLSPNEYDRRRLLV